MSPNRIRSLVRGQSKITDSVNVSLQPCFLLDNVNVLENEIKKTAAGSAHFYTLTGLLRVLEELLCICYLNGKQRRRSYVTEEEAFALFLSCNTRSSNHDLTRGDLRQNFRELLCHPKYGLCVYVVVGHYVVLRPDHVDLELFISTLIQMIPSYSKGPLKGDLVTDLFSTMDTEHDLRVLKMVIGDTHTSTELQSFPIDETRLPSYKTQVLKDVSERKSLKADALEVVNHKLKA